MDDGKGVPEVLGCGKDIQNMVVELGGGHDSWSSEDDSSARSIIYMLGDFPKLANRIRNILFGNFGDT